MHSILDIDGHKIAYSEHNPNADTPPIIYIHGILNTIHMQEAVLSDLLQGQHWFALSLPGHYPAQHKDGFAVADLTPEFIGHVLSEAVREIGQGQPVRLMGHSTGGFASLTIAHTSPELVESICLVDAFAQGTWHSLALRPTQIMANIPVVGWGMFKAYSVITSGNRLMIQQFIRFISYRFKVIQSNPKYAEFLDTVVQESGQLHIPDVFPYFHNMPKTDIRPWLPLINISTVILHGDNDPVILPRHAQEMDDLLPNSELIWFKDCGHDPFNESTEDLGQAIHKWLDGLEN